MNGTNPLKAKLLPLFALSSTLSFGQNVELEVGLPPAGVLGTIVTEDLDIDDIEATAQKPIHNIDVTNYSLEKLLEDLNKDQSTPFNYVFKNGAEKLVIPKLKLKSVTDEAFFEVLENTLEVRVQRIDNGTGADVIIISGPKERRVEMSKLTGLPNTSSLFKPAPKPDSKPRLESNTRVVAPAKNTTEGNSSRHYETTYNYDYGQVQRDPNSNSRFRLISPTPAKVSSERTQIFGTSDLTTDREVILDLIHTVWEVSDPNWKKDQSARILFHPKTGILIVKGSPDRIMEVESVLQTLRSQQIAKSQPRTPSAPSKSLRKVIESDNSPEAIPVPTVEKTRRR